MKSLLQLMGYEMNAVTKHEGALPALQMSENELISVLTTSLYPGANVNSVKMVLAYCKASHLDPMQKPVHIVPMWDKHSKSMRDVIMPGVGLYRTNAARTNQLAGISEPEFGPDVAVAGISVPEWCRVTVKRLVGGRECDFTAREYWIENYATASKDSDAPNTMWRKRSRGQLAKCTQAQALRMAFPEAIGAAPTADEMEGKSFNEFAGETIDGSTGEIITFDVLSALDAVAQATTPELLQSVWKEHGALAVAAKDKAGHAALKQAVIDRKDDLSNIVDAEVQS
jgi:phage recombination protein Bet